ncbi:MAG TPA: hypothetical protein VEI06_11795 [Gemmatimonadaceae bacterium]|nr:hypothetical protein [Gemmatimonadaceae bacterium]
MHTRRFAVPLLVGLVAGACSSSTSNKNSSPNTTPSAAERNALSQALANLGAALATIVPADRVGPTKVSAQSKASAQVVGPELAVLITALLSAAAQGVDQVTTVSNLTTDLVSGGTWHAFSADMTILNISSQEPTIEVIGTVLYQPSTTNLWLAGGPGTGGAISVDFGTNANGLVVGSTAPNATWGTPATGTMATSVMTSGKGTCTTAITSAPGVTACATSDYSAQVNVLTTSPLNTQSPPNTATGSKTATMAAAETWRGLAFTIDCSATGNPCGLSADRVRY